MAVRLFVGNLPYDTSEAELRQHFSAAGAVTFVSLPKDRETNRPRGFAFVEFGDPAQAAEAVRRFDGQPFKGRPLAVNEAREREAGSRPAGPPRSYQPDRSRPAESVPGEPPLRSDKPTRNFGPDAPRRGKKGPARGGAKPRGPKGPIREKVLTTWTGRMMTRPAS
jgi:RNA recognition motif-containing protein